MENISYQVTIGETSRVYPAGTTYLSIAREFQDQYEHQIVLVVQNGSRLEELHRELDRDCTLEFVTDKRPDRSRYLQEKHEFFVG